MVWLLVTVAVAQEEVCGGILPRSEYDEALEAVDLAIADGSGARADRILDDVHEALPCADFVLSPADVGRLARQEALLAFYQQDRVQLELWWLLARETGVTSTERWSLPDTFADLVDGFSDREPAALDGQGLRPPKKGGVLLDGRLVLEPVASPGVPHLVQVVDKHGAPIRTAWQDGIAFDPDLLGTPTSLSVPRWYDEPPTVAPEPVATAPVAPEPAAPEPAATEPVAVRFDDALDADCPWKGSPRKVEVSRREIGVNRKTFPIGTPEEQLALAKTLRTCGEYRAARRFARWQEARGKPFSGAAAHRDAMIDALLTDEPKRRRR